MINQSKYFVAPPMSSETAKRLSDLSKRLPSGSLFPKKVEHAREILKNVKHLP